MLIKEVIQINESPDEEIYDFIYELNADDVGQEQFGDYIVRFEGFSDWCQQDAAERCDLPDNDPRKLNAYDDVYDEVQNGWNKEMGAEPVDTGFSGDDEYPVQWAIYKIGVTEDLRKWFKQKWVRFGPDGKIRGDCARGDDSEGKPKCLPQSKAYALGKKGRAKAAGRKRRQDPDAERRGPAKNVATK
jgi:hypothetical protein